MTLDAEHLASPAVIAAVAEERRFGGLEAQLTILQATLTTLVSKVGEQNGRVGKLESGLTALAANAELIENRKMAFRAGQENTLSLIDKVMMRVTATASTVIAVYLGLQQAGIL